MLYEAVCRPGACRGEIKRSKTVMRLRTERVFYNVNVLRRELDADGHVVQKIHTERIAVACVCVIDQPCQ